MRSNNHSRAPAPSLPLPLRACSTDRRLGGKAFDLTYHPDGPQSHHVVITAKLRNKRKVTVYCFKVEPTSYIDTLKRVVEADGHNAHHQQWYSSISGKEASPGPFNATKVGEDKSLNGMAYYCAAVVYGLGGLLDEFPCYGCLLDTFTLIFLFLQFESEVCVAGHEDSPIFVGVRPSC